MRPICTAARILEIPVAGVALVTEPGLFLAPVDGLVRLPDIRAPSAEAEGLEAHRLERDVAGKNQEVGPGNLAAVLLLDRPEQSAGLIEVHVVRPGVERREALLTVPGTPAAIADAVGARGVPCHADEESPVMTEIRRPPVLAARHPCAKVLLERFEVELAELGSIMEVLAHGIGQGRVLAENSQV